MSDSEESNGSDQQYTVVDEIAPESDSRRRTRRRDSKQKKSTPAVVPSQPEFESEEDNSNSNVASRYEEDEDYHEPTKKNKRGSRGGSDKKKSRKAKSKSQQDSDEEVALDDDESERSVPPLKIKLPSREKSKRSSKRKSEIPDAMSNDEDEVDGNIASSSRSKSKSSSNGSSKQQQQQSQQDDSTHAPTRRSERIFVSNTKKVTDDDEFEEFPEEEEEPFKIIHKDYCQSCRQGGELILCDYCPRAYHKVCLDNELDELPEDWCCPNCEKNGKPDPKELRQQQEALIAKKKKKQKDIAGSSKPKPKGKEIENRDYCEICNQCGELLLCDTCPRAYHLVCMDANMKAIPSGTWSCPHCVEHGIEICNDEAISEEKAEKVEKIICKGCRQTGGEIIFCATCPTRYHIQCMNPPLDEAPEEWHCMACSVEPLKAKVQRILTWRWKKTPKDSENDKNKLSAEDSTKNLLKNLKNRRPREREFFVKWKDMSYWHTSWVDDSQLQVFHSNLYRFYIQKNDMNNPPMFDEVGTITTESMESKSDDSNSTDINETSDQGIKASVAAKHRRQKRCCNLSPELEKTYVRYGIRPEWLLIQRIINHRKSRGKLYYVIKWRDLPYDEVTVEPEPENCDFEIPDYQKKIDEYWNLKRLIDEENAELDEKSSSKKRDKDDKRKKDKKKKAFGSGPRTDPKKKWDDQPDYIPEPLKLHEYQIEGCTWLRFSWASGIDTILADEMGLGKTIQTVTFLYSLYKEGHSRGPFLIAAPLSTIINWERELEDWAPDFYVVNYTGNKDSRIIIRENELSFDSDATRSSAKATRIRKNIPVKFHVMLTSYELINMDSALLSSIDWKVLVVDEAHRLKSNQSLFFRTLNNYSVAHKLLLTGTPLQNNLEELFNLLNFLSPGRFCDMEGFLSEFADIAKEEQVKKLHELLGSHLLRRLKADVLTGMPSKSEFIIRVDLAPLQKKYYKYILTRNYDALNQKGVGKQVSLLNVVMDLKKCCNHPYLFPVAAEEAPKTKFGYFEGAPLVKACGKLLVLHKMLQKLKADGHRVLIFSQMTQMLDILEDFCEAEGYKYERIDGSITGSVRQESIDRFNAPGAQQFVFLLSTRAGGLGINLATADTVIIYDSDWNPHNDIQALSRAHRIGQTNKVMIYRFVTRNSVEERITQVAKKKMMLTHLVVRPGLGSTKNAAMSKQELDDILKFGTEELFKEEEGKETETIHYDDKAIEELLDRSNEGIEQKEMWSNEYLSSFKVASYATKEAEEEEAEAAPAKPVKDESQNDPHYWEKLLGAHYLQYQENVSRTLGKGKRVRKQVNYMDSATGQNEFQTQESSGESSEFSVPSDQSENDEDFDERIESRNQKSLRTKNPVREKMPPLLSQMGPNTEVIGFTPKHRKTFLDLVMRFGLPSLEHNITDSQFYVRELKSKSEKHLRAYASLFISHLCEPGDPSSLTFDDGVPKEGLNVSQVLTRIGIISLIKRKVFEFQHLHGSVSMKLAKKPQISLIAPASNAANGNELIDLVKNETKDKAAAATSDNDNKDKVEDEKADKEGDEKKENIDQDKEKTVDDKDKIDDEIKDKVDELKDKVDEEMKDKADDEVEAEKVEAKKEEPMEVDEPAKEIKEETDKAEDEEVKKDEDAADKNDSKVKEESNENSTAKAEDATDSEDKPIKTEANGVIEVKSDDEEESETEVKPFEFTIQDGGLTELHTLWYFEDKELKPKHEHEIWNRRHDFWMLAGIVRHGYERWNDVSRDEVFSILNEPFKSSSHLRDKFMERRLRLLEQALVFEEQLRRFSHLEKAERLVPKPGELEKMAVDVEENNKDDEDTEKEKDETAEDKEDKDESVQNGDKEEEEVKNGHDAETKQNGDKEKDDEVDADKKKKNGDSKKVDNDDEEESSKKQNGDTEESSEDKENEESNMILNPTIQRAANQLEDLLIDMKSDCARIPQTVQRIPSIANRLQIGPPRSGAPTQPTAGARMM